jgi:hypothetical protein
LANTSVAMVESTPVFGKMAPFAGGHWNEGLGRSVTVRKGSLPQTNGRADDSRVFFGRRGGERRQRTQKKRTHPDASGKQAKRASGGHVLHSVQRPVHVNRHYTSGGASRTKVTRFSGYRGWANPRKREEPTPGSGKPDEECTARLVSPVPQGMQRGAKEKEGGCGLRPCEETRAPVRARTS